MNDEKKKSESFYESHFRVIDLEQERFLIATDDDRHNELLRHESLLAFPFFTSFSILLTVQHMDS